MARFQPSQTKVVNYHEAPRKTMTKDQPRFLFQVRNCPKSLKTIVKFYRFFGYAFSGITFDEDNERSDKSAPHSSVPVAGILWLLFNLAVLAFKCTMPYLLKIRNAASAADQVPIEEQTLSHYFGMNQYVAEFEDLKPILRMIMESVLYVYVTETSILYVANIFNGGRLVRQLTMLPSSSFDTDGSFAKRCFKYLFGILILSNVLGNLMFNRGQIGELFAWLFGYQATLPQNKQLQLVKLAIVTVMHTFNDILVSIIPVLFLYSMLIFRHHVNVLQESVRKVDLDEIHLVKIKNKLTALNEQFHVVVSNFSVSITTSLISITFLLVSSSCYLMINQGKAKNQMCFIFVYAFTSFTRLVIICATGNLVTNAHRNLIRAIYESVREWNLAGWMCFNEIRRLKGKFKVVIFSTYSVKQSAILAVIAFALNYIVVLLQTENYVKASSGLQGNASQVEA